MMNRYLCERCDHFVSAIDLLPVSNYFIRDDIKIDETRVLAGQCICGGLCYECSDEEMIAHMEREIQARGLTV